MIINFKNITQQNILINTDNLTCMQGCPTDSTKTEFYLVDRSCIIINMDFDTLLSTITI